ncbi:hypothetical protein O6H91_18G018500 [Diphasiastrum complanatum]|uniref:Uncharacterized protein n=6 Tax=Diphasiastrum complanatum TaxID=34168 RepID=A0ACC2AYM0_DIPCM|nr:hypothetical protein O6H91_18G018500 [Diphasiastrum complanatum]KAJ7522584.1 hypothetical protein O6H91_18G018500 [Diphasiastrum complanatum]KAJ7522585.1 hypothetical protein O6H91_18G018500 [Diphasiastrum complanatum]KAJ7522586.1 hypothetical protein O6H91_18G018500 [Diphasiastrum complanatum]KAJ7522587.1 hypothetical protein O6H91_18G018500 [Diphasiastrum complanatum]
MARRITSFGVAFFFIGIVHGWGTSSFDSLTSEDLVTRKSVYRTPAFTLTPGEVSSKFYRVEFPKGHVGVRGFDAEVVDEAGNPVSLFEVYLHHWLTFNLYVKKTEKEAFLNEGYYGSNNPSTRFVGNSGLCRDGPGSTSWGLGSETRHTNTTIPPPYAIEIGNSENIPDGYEEMWEFNVHAIDTRGVADRPGCTECRCNLYGVVNDERGKPLPKDYIGGLECCYDGTKCRLKPGFESTKRTLYMQYTIRWIEWSENMVPVKKYVIDVTNTGSGCKIEYNTPTCSLSGFPTDCIDTRETTASLPEDSILIYAAAHQHVGARGASLYGANGKEICRSMPAYGFGSEAGNEAGYVVGMGACYPEPGSVKISSKDVLRMQSNYSTFRGRTGVMGLFNILVASDTYSMISFKKSDSVNLGYGIQELLNDYFLIIGFVGGIAAFGLGRYYQFRKQQSEGYQAVFK